MSIEAVNAAPVPAPAPTLTVTVFPFALVIGNASPDAGSLALGYFLSEA